jgi:molecular chaperone DnaJ
VQRKNGTAGDLLVTVNVAVPQRLSSDAARRWRSTPPRPAGDDPRAHLQEVVL